MATLTKLIDFNITNGAVPEAGLIIDAAGDLFGTTAGGGTNNAGTVFEVVNTGTGYGSTPTTLVSFNGTNGSVPQASLLVDAAGNIVGTTETGGNGVGTVFELASSGGGYASTPSTLFAFTTSIGSYPHGISDIAGNLFVVASGGGANGEGALLEIANTSTGYASTPTTLVNFNGTNGANPNNAPISDASGDLIGTADFGGAGGDGVLYEIANTGTGYASTPTVLFNFNGTNGREPSALVADAAGDLFGTARFGGAYGDGNVFEFVKTVGGYASVPTILASFYGTNGSTPNALIIDAAGNLFGTTSGGGAYNVGTTSGDGTVFEIANTSTGYATALTTLANFNGTNGMDPSSLVADAAGNLFGTTENGGVPGHGTVFEVSGVGVPPPATPIAIWDFNLLTSLFSSGRNIEQNRPATISIQAAPNTFVSLYDGAALIGTGTTDSSGYAAISASKLNQGPHALTATAGTGLGDIVSAPTGVFDYEVVPAGSAGFSLGASNGNIGLGVGNDQINFTTGTVFVNSGVGSNTIVGGSGYLFADLGGGNNVVAAGGGGDTVIAQSGNNTVNLGDGNDTVTLGDGANTVILGGGNDSVTLGGGTNSVWLGNGANVVSVGNSNNLVELGSGANTVTVGNGSNYVQAGIGNNVVTAGTGSNGIQLGNGNNHLALGAGSDVVVLGNGMNVVDMGTGTSSLSVGSGTNTITATSGNQTVDMSAGGTNSVALGSGNNTIYGGGTDTLLLGGGNNIVSLLDAPDSVTAGDGANQVHLANVTSSATVNLGNGANTVVTNTGGAAITLGSGNNFVDAVGGDNVIMAGTGLNVIIAGGGNDTFNVGGGFIHGSGTIDTFNLGSGGGAAYGGSGTNGFNLNGGAWYIAAASGPDTIALDTQAVFADVQAFDVLKDMLVFSNAAYGLGVSGLSGSETAPVGSLLSSTTDGSFSSSSALFSYNASNGYVDYRSSSLASPTTMAVLENHPSSIAGNVLVGA